MNKKRYVKSFVAVLVALMLCLSIPIFALVPSLVSVSSVPEFSSVLKKNGSRYDLGVFPVASASEALKTKWLQSMDVVEGRDKTKSGILLFLKNPEGKNTVNIFTWDSSVVSTGEEFTGYKSSAVNGMLGFKFPYNSVDEIYAFVDSNGLSGFGTRQTSYIQFATCGTVPYEYTVLADFNTSLFNTVSFSKANVKYRYISDANQLAIVDDLREPDPEPTPDPEPEPPPYVPPAPPTFGGSSEFLPYDPAIFEALVWYLRDAIGSAGKVLILVVFILGVVGVIFSLIRHALSGGSNDGGGSGLL